MKTEEIIECISYKGSVLFWEAIILWKKKKNYQALKIEDHLISSDYWTDSLYCFCNQHNSSAKLFTAFKHLIFKVREGSLFSGKEDKLKKE